MLSSSHCEELPQNLEAALEKYSVSAVENKRSTMKSALSMHSRFRTLWQLFLVSTVTTKAFLTVNRLQQSAHATLHDGMSMKNTDVTERALAVDMMSPFLEWATQEGIKAPKCEVFTFPGGLRGLRAREDIDDGEIFLQVPLRLCFTSDPQIMEKLNNAAEVHENKQDTASNDKNMPIVASVSEAFQWPVRLAIRLITERRKMELDENGSIWNAYIATLPQPKSNKDSEIHSNDQEGSAYLSSTLPVHWDDVSSLEFHKICQFHVFHFIKIPKQICHNR